MIELYHSVNSVCAQKVRVALAEKGLEYREHLNSSGSPSEIVAAGYQWSPGAELVR